MILYLHAILTSILYFQYTYIYEKGENLHSNATKRPSLLDIIIVIQIYVYIKYIYIYGTCHIYIIFLILM